MFAQTVNQKLTLELIHLPIQVVSMSAAPFALEGPKIQLWKCDTLSQCFDCLPLAIKRQIACKTVRTFNHNNKVFIDFTHEGRQCFIEAEFQN